MIAGRGVRPQLILPELSYRITGVLFEVHNALGRFAREVQYANAIAQRFDALGIAYLRERDIPFRHDAAVVHGNIVDFLVEQQILIELKAKPAFEPKDFVQLHRYLDASSVRLGILVNFRDRYLRPRRVVRKDVAIRGIGDHS